MILFEKYYYKRFSPYKIIEHGSTSCRQTTIYRTPSIFLSSNILNPQIIDCLDNINNNFYSLWLSIEKFISGQAGYRDRSTEYLTTEEVMFLEVDCNYDNFRKIDRAICIRNKVRIFVIKDLAITYRIIDYKYKNNLEDSSKDMISIFIGSEFYEDEMNYLNLIYSLSETLIKMRLKELGVPFNRCFYDNHNREFIVLSSYYRTPSDTMFIVEYYKTIFINIINCTNNNIISSYDDMFNNLNNINSLIISYYDNDIMRELWNHCVHICADEATNTDLLDVYCKMYKKYY